MWCHSLKRWARTQDSGQGCWRTRPRYSSASSHTAGLRPSNSAGLCRLPSAGGPGGSAQGAHDPRGTPPLPVTPGQGCRRLGHEAAGWAGGRRGGGGGLTCTHDPLHPRIPQAALHVLQALDVPVGKHRDGHGLPVGAGGTQRRRRPPAGSTQPAPPAAQRLRAPHSPHGPDVCPGGGARQRPLLLLGAPVHRQQLGHSGWLSATKGLAAPAPAPPGGTRARRCPAVPPG